jgi:hypothetical protein
MPLKRSIGALAVIDSDDPSAIVQVRDAEDSYPGCLQLTIHGGVEDEETLKAALDRETREEIRELFQRASLFPPNDLIENVEATIHDIRIVHRIRTTNRQVVSLSAKLDPSMTPYLRPLIERDIIRLVTRNELRDIRVINSDDPEHKKSGLGGSISAMFEDDLRVLKIALGDQGSKQQ